MTIVKIQVTHGSNIINLFEHVPAGSARWTWYRQDGGINWRPAPFIKTDEGTRDSFGSNPQNSIRVATLTMNDVYLFIPMVKVGRNA